MPFALVLADPLPVPVSSLSWPLVLAVVTVLVLLVMLVIQIDRARRAHASLTKEFLESKDGSRVLKEAFEEFLQSLAGQSIIDARVEHKNSNLLQPVTAKIDQLMRQQKDHEKRIDERLATLMTLLEQMREDVAEDRKAVRLLERDVIRRPHTGTDG